MNKLVGAVLMLLVLNHSAFGQTSTEQFGFTFPPSPESAFVGYGYDDPMMVADAAANGYGIWQVGTTPDGNGHCWRLAGNELAQHFGNVPNGFIASGNLPFEATRVVCNLKGSVRFLGLNAARNAFMIAGLNDDQLTGIPPQAQQINIRLTNLQVSAANREVVSAPVYLYPDISTTVQQTKTCPSGTPGLEDEPVAIDPLTSGIAGGTEWDVAMDAKYLYIIWEHQEQMAPRFDGYELYVKAVSLQTGAEVATFILRDRGTSGFDMRHPTIACDVRNAPAAPEFDVAYIQSNTNGSTTTYEAAHRAFVNGANGPGQILVKNLIVPADGPPPGNQPTTTTGSYSDAVYARVLVNKRGVAGSGNTLDYGVYVVGTDGTSTILALYTSCDLTAGRYVDGPNSATSFPNEKPPLTGKHSVDPTAVRGFVDPYDDGAVCQGADPYHCVYGVGHSAYILVRGCNNGSAVATHLPLTDTREILNKTSTPSLISVNAFPATAVNQMGVNSYWADNTNLPSPSEYHIRSPKFFDEPIEENTVVSYACYVGDGTGHNGTVGATLQAGKTMLLWTDPTYLFTISNTVAPHYHNAQLYIYGGSLSAGTSYTLATLLTFPNFEVNFMTSPSYGIVVKPNSVFDYYGTSGGAAATNFFGDGLIKMDGTGHTVNNLSADGLYWYPTVQDPAILTVHGGASLRLNGCSYFELTDAKIDVKHEAEIGSPTITADGLVDLSCRADVTSSEIDGHATASTVIFQQHGYSCSSTASNFANCVWQNVDNSGSAEFHVDDPLTEVNVTGGKTDRFSLSAYFADESATNPTRPLSIQNVWLENIPAYGIYLNRLPNASSTIDYEIAVSGCVFRSYIAAGGDGVLAESFYPRLPDPNLYAIPLQVTSCDFLNPVGFNDTSHVTAAIHFVDCSGLIQGNEIDGYNSTTGAGYAHGILNEKVDNSKAVMSNTLICSNSVQHAGYAPSSGLETGAGITTTYWEGYSKLNRVAAGGVGEAFFGYQNGAVIFSNVHDNRGPGLLVDNQASNETTNLDLRGVVFSSDHSLDYGAYDTIRNNNLNYSASSGQISLVDATLKLGGKVPGYSAFYGYNNIIENANSNDNLVYGNSGSWINSGSGPRQFDFNYFEVAGSAYTPAAPSGDPEVQVNYATSLPTTVSTTMISCPFAVSCFGGSLEASRGAAPTPFALVEDTVDDCDRLSFNVDALVHSNNQQERYDSTKKFLRYCYQARDWNQFGGLMAANLGRSNDNERYVECREFLKSILYLRSDSLWYCADVRAILGTMAWMEGRGYDIDGALAIQNYIVAHQRCDTALFNKNIRGDLRERYVIWKDTVRDSLATPYPDTVLPSLEDLKLQILEGPQAGVGAEPLRAVVAPVISVTDNPFVESTSLRFTLADHELVGWKLYDLLGNELRSNQIGVVMGPGEQRVPIPTTGLPPGAYYVRVSIRGAVPQTIRLVKK